MRCSRHSIEELRKPESNLKIGASGYSEAIITASRLPRLLSPRQSAERPL
jgi:hypothetical protein